MNAGINNGAILEKREFPQNKNVWTVRPTKRHFKNYLTDVNKKNINNALEDGMKVADEFMKEFRTT